MRWQARAKRPWSPWFAFLPLRDRDNRMIWLEPIWVRWAGDYSEWCPWETLPNGPAPASTASPEGLGDRARDEHETLQPKETRNAAE